MQDKIALLLSEYDAIIYAYSSALLCGGIVVYGNGEGERCSGVQHDATISRYGSAVLCLYRTPVFAGL